MAKKNTRENILLAAENLFSENGFDGVSTKTIAHKAGITEMTLFNHFHSKEKLYKSIVQEKYLSIEIKSTFTQLSYDNLEKDLLIISDKIISNYVENKNILKMRLKEKQSFHNNEIYKMENDPLLIQIIPIFQMYYKKEMINLNGEKAAILFITTLKGICHISLLENKSLKDMHQVITEFNNIFCLGLKNYKQ